MRRAILLLALAAVSTAQAADATAPRSARATCPADGAKADPVAMLEMEALRRRIVALEERVEGLELQLQSEISATPQPQEDRP